MGFLSEDEIAGLTPAELVAGHADPDPQSSLSDEYYPGGAEREAARGRGADAGARRRAGAQARPEPPPVLPDRRRHGGRRSWR